MADKNSLVDTGGKEGQFSAGHIIDALTGLFGGARANPQQAAAIQSAQQPAAAGQSPPVYQVPGVPATPAAGAGTMDPLAVQLFFTQAIAPMLQNLASGLQTQNKSMTDVQDRVLEHFQMPEQFKALFGNEIKDQGVAQNNVLASLTGAAASAPALDELMQNVTAARQASQKQYYEELLGQVANNPFGAALNGLTAPTTGG